MTLVIASPAVGMDAHNLSLDPLTSSVTATDCQCSSPVIVSPTEETDAHMDTASSHCLEMDAHTNSISLNPCDVKTIKTIVLLLVLFRY